MKKYTVQYECNGKKKTQVVNANTKSDAINIAKSYVKSSPLANKSTNFVVIKCEDIEYGTQKITFSELTNRLKNLEK